MLIFLILGARVSGAQCTREEPSCRQAVPHLIKFSGILKQFSGLPDGRVVPLRLVIYGDATAGTPLWLEIQNVQVDSQGRYEVMLGATANDGMPMELFTNGEPRWLAVQPLWPGETEQPRILLVSVPYALKAGDAHTLGGLPASAYAKVAGPAATSSVSPTAVVAAPSIAPLTDLESIPKSSVAQGAPGDTRAVVTTSNSDNIIYADHFSGGVPEAITACPASGCVIYAVSPNTNRGLGTIDPGTKAVTIYLGPYTYTVNQITLRKGMKIIGMGASGGVNGSPTCSVARPCNGTKLQSVNGNNPVFIIPQTANTPATNVLLSSFRVLGAVGNTSEDGFLLDSSSVVNNGLWYSTLEDIYLEGFAGTAIHVKGRNNDFSSATQWVLFNNVIVYRNPGGQSALRLEGATFELRFRNCQFDGQRIGDGTNIYIGGRSGGLGGFPISIVFEGLVSQSAATAVQLDGAYNIVFYASHHESLWGGYQVTNNTNIGVQGLTITDSYFAGNVGQNASAGYALKIGTTLARGIFFTHNQLFGNPDSVISGNNLASVVYQDNFYAGPLAAPPTSGITAQMNPAASIDIFGLHSIGLNTSTTPITTIQSGLGPGEIVTFFALGGPVVFGSGGNLDLLGAAAVTVTGTITFARFDLGGPIWRPIAQWSAPSAQPAPAKKAQL